jgi:hypothetical protein
VNSQPQDDTEKRIDRVLKFLKSVEDDDNKSLASISNDPYATRGQMSDTASNFSVDIHSVSKFSNNYYADHHQQQQQQQHDDCKCSVIYMIDHS